MNALKEEWTKLSMPHELSSIIDVDMYMLGLIYWVLVKQRQLDDAKVENLKTRLNDKIRQFKRDSSHTKSPSSLKYLRERITASIDAYRNSLM